MKTRKLRKAQARRIKRVNDYQETCKNAQNPSAFREPGSMKK